MAKFPIFESLVVDGYLLYPGHDSSEAEVNLSDGEPAKDHLALDFSAGPWIILGVNGLGKSTLLMLLKHLLVGAVRTRDAGFAGDRSDIIPLDSRFFAVRVRDGARAGTGTLSVRIGTATLKVQRRLSDLGFVEGTVCDDEGEHPLSLESEWRAQITERMGLSRFEDALRVIDRIVFFLEVRSPLIWDVSAQFELFRALLTPENSVELRRLEAEIVSNDSSARNLNVTVFKLSSRRDREMRLIETAADTQAQIAVATANRDKAQANEVRLLGKQDDCNVRLADARVQLKRSERDSDAAANTYEEIKYRLLRHAFAGISPNEQYVFLKIISDRLCLACGSQAEGAALELETRRIEGRCLVCGTPRETGADVVGTTDALTARASKAYDALTRAREDLELARTAHVEIEAERNAIAVELEQSRQLLDREDALLRKLYRQLPAEDRATLSREEDRIEALRREVLRFRADRDSAEEEISGLLDQLREATVVIRTRLEEAFHELSKNFFAEQVRLVYAPRRERIGQSGRLFDFPSFEVEMTSGATQGEFARRTQEQVSLSQREYLDVIFRMSLLQTVGDGGCSLIVDGPEGSLDAVFAGRAGDLFAGFGGRTDHNVILACNIIEGAFLPNTLRDFKTEAARRERVVNLLENAFPTSALRELRSSYREAVAVIMRAEPRSL